MNPITSLYFIAKHPFSRHQPLKGILRYIGWQLQSKLTGIPRLFRFTPNSHMWLAPGLRGASGNYYCGLHEYADMVFVMHFLQPGELFLDVGANVGSYSLIAAAECKARVIAFEPVPASFKWLQKNIDANQLGNLIHPVCKAIGMRKGTCKMTHSLDAQNHLVTEELKDSIEVEIDTLDNLLKDESPAIIKIDVEGLEDQVLGGAVSTISRQSLLALIVEMGNKEFPNGEGLSCHHWLLKAGFHAFSYNPDIRVFDPINHPSSHNTIYLRDSAVAMQRIENAKMRTIWNNRF